jgi:hypothetical protein
MFLFIVSFEIILCEIEMQSIVLFTLSELVAEKIDWPVYFDWSVYFWLINIDGAIFLAICNAILLLRDVN